MAKGPGNGNPFFRGDRLGLFLLWLQRLRCRHPVLLSQPLAQGSKRKGFSDDFSFSPAMIMKQHDLARHFRVAWHGTDIKGSTSASFVLCKVYIARRSLQRLRMVTLCTGLGGRTGSKILTRLGCVLRQRVIPAFKGRTFSRSRHERKSFQNKVGSSEFVCCPGTSSL